MADEATAFPEPPAAAAVPPTPSDGKQIIDSLEEMFDSKDEEYRTIQTWDGKYSMIGSLSGEDLIEWTEANEGTPAVKRTAGARLILKSLVNKDHKRIGNADDPAQVKRLLMKNHAILERIAKEILDLNGMSQKAVTAAKKE